MQGRPAADATDASLGHLSSIDKGETTMTTKYLSIGLAALIGIALASCDDKATDVAGGPVAHRRNDKNLTALTTCLSFDGIDHCGIGATDLNLDGATLKVDQFGPGGTDGVSSDLVGGATEWTQTATVDCGDLATFNMKIAAIDNGNEAMSLTFTSNGSDVRAVPTFGDGASGYSIRGYRNGELVFEQDNVTDLGDAPVFNGIEGVNGCWYPVISTLSTDHAIYELQWFSPCPVPTVMFRGGGEMTEVDRLDLSAAEGFNLDHFDHIDISGTLKSLTVSAESYTN
jgi:hypothetical protein